MNIYRLSNVNVAEDKRNNKYISGNVVKDGKTIPFKKFGASEESIQTMKEGVFVEIVSFKENSYNNTTQYLLENVRVLSVEEVMEKDLIPKSIYTEECLNERVQKYIERIEDPNLRKTAQWLLDRYGKDFRKIPAARSHHHDYIHGLLEHSLNVVESCIKHCVDYPNIDMDVLIFSALFHDIGKIYEYEKNEYSLLTGYSEAGHLLGHLQIGHSMIHQAMEETNYKDHKKLKILHCILSHHGKPEWGSAIPPKTFEAVILHNMDVLDAQTAAINKALNSTEDSSVFVRSVNTLIFK